MVQLLEALLKAGKLQVQFLMGGGPSSHTMAPRPTQPLTEMSTRDVSWGKGSWCVGLTTMPLSCADVWRL